MGATGRLSGNGGAGFGTAYSTIMPGGLLVLQGNSAILIWESSKYQNDQLVTATPPLPTQGASSTQLPSSHTSHLLLLSSPSQPPVQTPVQLSDPNPQIP